MRAGGGAMAIVNGAGACALAISFVVLGQVPAAYAVPGPAPGPSPVQAQPEGLPPKMTEALDGYRRDAAAAALGNPVMYGDGQCYPLIQHYIEALGVPWRNTDPSGNAFDLYEHFPTNGLSQFFDQIPFAGGANQPQVGDIAIYGPGGFVSEHGHAAVVTAVDRNGFPFRYETADQNSGGRLFVTLNWRDFNPAYNTLGYLRPKA